MNLLSLEVIQKNHRKELEQRLENAKTNLKNLDRMAEETFREVDRRATEDKEMLAKVFNTLTTNEEVTISSLKEELGLGLLTYEGQTDGTDLSKFHEFQSFIEPTIEEANASLEAARSRKPKNGGKKDAAV